MRGPGGLMKGFCNAASNRVDDGSNAVVPTDDRGESKDIVVSTTDTTREGVDPRGGGDMNADNGSKGNPGIVVSTTDTTRERADPRGGGDMNADNGSKGNPGIVVSSKENDADGNDEYTSPSNANDDGTTLDAGDQVDGVTSGAIQQSNPSPSGLADNDSRKGAGNGNIGPGAEATGSVLTGAEDDDNGSTTPDDTADYSARYDGHYGQPMTIRNSFNQQSVSVAGAAGNLSYGEGNAAYFAMTLVARNPAVQQRDERRVYLGDEFTLTLVRSNLSSIGVPRAVRMTSTNALVVDNDGTAPSTRFTLSQKYAWSRKYPCEPNSVEYDANDINNRNFDECSKYFYLNCVTRCGKRVLRAKTGSGGWVRCGRKGGNGSDRNQFVGNGDGSWKNYELELA
jgi:hypothetical protein